MHASFVNELMACAWIEAGNEIEGIGQRSNRTDEISKKLDEIAKRPKPKFNF